MTVLQIATLILGITGSASPVQFIPCPPTTPHDDGPISAAPVTSSDGSQP
jgi:hypothetical protein